MNRNTEAQSAQFSGILHQNERSTPQPRLPLALVRFVKFCVTGASGVFVDMGILYLLGDPKTFGLNITLSKVLAAELAMVNNFVWNEFWTFRSISPSLSALGGESRSEDQVSCKGLFRRFLVFNAICGIGIGFAVVLLHLFHTWVGWNLYLSNFLTIIFVACWNFGMNARFNWCIGNSRL